MTATPGQHPKRTEDDQLPGVSRRAHEAHVEAADVAQHRLVLLAAEVVREAAPGTRQATIIEAARHLASVGIYEPLGAAVLTEAAHHTISTAKGEDPSTPLAIRNLLTLGWAKGENRPTAEDLLPERDSLSDLDEIATAWHQHDDRSRGWWRRQIVMENALRAAYEYGSRINVPFARKRLGAAEDPLANPTVVTVLEELTEAGWLTLLRAGRPGEAARYALSIPASVADEETPGEANRLALQRWLTVMCPASRYWDAVSYDNPSASRPTSTWLATDPAVARPRHSIFVRIPEQS